MKKYQVAFLGIGNRGHIYAKGMFDRGDVEIAALCDVNENSLQKTGDEFAVPQEMRFSDAEQFFARGKLAQALVISTPDRTHCELCIRALRLGYDVLLEKPIAETEEECNAILSAADECKRKVVVCHVLRYTDFYHKLKELLLAGTIGKLIHINHSENVGWWHYTQSFVRGHWKNCDRSSPMILQKCCHDFDLINWLTEMKCTSVSSVGALTYFKEENAPKGSGKYCFECARRDDCLYNAVARSQEMPESIVAPYGFDYSNGSIEKLLSDKSNDWAKCVYRSDNNVVDHQSAIMQFEGGATAVLDMHAFAQGTYRETKLVGTKGEIVAKFGETCEITVNLFAPVDEFCARTYTVPLGASGHGGGDRGIVDGFISYVFEGKRTSDVSSLEVSVASHKMAFAAEQSRLQNGAPVAIQ